MDPHFEYLTGTVKVPASAPTEWEKGGLGEFYRAPNDDAWGATLCRVLYHESIHFWQLFSSAYVGNLVADDWRRLQHFHSTGEISPLDPEARQYDIPAEGLPFSSRELLECWARFWDVHTRGAGAIIRDEGYPAEEVNRLEIIDPYTGSKSYTHEAYDYLMRGGPGSSFYEQPYRWLLDQTQGHSAFVAITFPILVHSAFGSPNPVAVFCEAFDRAWNSSLLRGAIDSRSGNINLDWLNQWSAIIGEAHIPVIRKHHLPDFTSGLDVIERGSLGSHPIYKEYVDQVEVLRGHLILYKQQFAAGPVPSDVTELYNYAITDMPTRDPWVVFGLPGQPDYRYLLGQAFSPARVQFENYILDGRRPVARRLREMATEKGGDETYSSVLDDLTPLVERFRRAEYAVSRGLPADSFE